MIGSLGYDPEANILVIRFQGGKIYQYDDVPSDVFLSLVTERGSIGETFNRLVQSKSYTYKEINHSEAHSL